MHALEYYDSETLRSEAALTTNGRYRVLENMIVGRPLRAMFVHKVCELVVLRILSIRVEVIADFVHVHGDPMLSWLVAVVCVAHESGGYVEATSGRVYLATIS